MGAFIGPETSFEIVLSSRVYEAELGTGGRAATHV